MMENIRRVLWLDDMLHQSALMNWQFSRMKRYGEPSVLLHSKDEHPQMIFCMRFTVCLHEHVFCTKWRKKEAFIGQKYQIVSRRAGKLTRKIYLKKKTKNSDLRKQEIERIQSKYESVSANKLKCFGLSTWNWHCVIVIWGCQNDGGKEKMQMSVEVWYLYSIWDIRCMLTRKVDYGALIFGMLPVSLGMMGEIFSLRWTYLTEPLCKSKSWL